MWSLQIKGQAVTLPQPAVMGIVNATRDSFYNACGSVSEAIDLAAQQVAEGAHIIDVGAEATNPTLNELHPDAQAQLDLCVPIVEALSARFPVLISVDSSEPIVMRAVANAGAHILNDQRALLVDGALEAAAETGLAVCLMHGVVQVRKPGAEPADELQASIINFLLERAQCCVDAGIPAESIIIDPGFGGGNFGKSADENMYLLRHFEQFVCLPYPVLAGLSRKSMIGAVTGKPIAERLAASVAAALIAAQKGAAILRVHDVTETVDMLAIYRS